MYLYKCDICGYVQNAEGQKERFYHVSEITQGDRLLYQDRVIVDIDFCSKCFKRFQNSKEKGD